MDHKEPRSQQWQPEELTEAFKAFEREREEARELSRRHAEQMREAHERDRQVLIERRRNPR